MIIKAILSTETPISEIYAGIHAGNVDSIICKEDLLGCLIPW